MFPTGRNKDVPSEIDQKKKYPPDALLMNDHIGGSRS